jgi:hypothetical protein
MTDLLLRRAPKSRPGADDYDVIGADGLVIGRPDSAKLSQSYR